MMAMLTLTRGPYRNDVQCFVGKACVDIMIKKQFANTIQDGEQTTDTTCPLLPLLTKFNTSKYSSYLPLAVALGNLMLHAGIIEHVVQDHGFENAYYYYHFIKDKPDHGSKSFLPSIDNIEVLLHAGLEG